MKAVQRVTVQPGVDQHADKGCILLLQKGSEQDQLGGGNTKHKRL